MDVETARNVLGVSNGSDGQTIRRKYLEFSLHNHPDKGGDTDRFVLANVAYNVLMESWKEEVIERMHGSTLRIFHVIATSDMICAGYRGRIDAIYYETCEVCMGLGASCITDVVTCIACSMGNDRCKACNSNGVFVKQGKECIMCGGLGTQKKNKCIHVSFPAGVSNGQQIGSCEGKNVCVTYAHGIRKRNNDIILDLDISLRDCLCGFSTTIDTFHGSKTIGSRSAINCQKAVISGNGILGIGDFIVVLHVRMTQLDAEIVQKYREVFDRIYRNTPSIDARFDAEF